MNRTEPRRSTTGGGDRGAPGAPLTGGGPDGTTGEPPAPGREEGRSARKRRAIVDAAAELFLQHGYQGTSMDDVAARAAVSKQTVYKNFADKERLFTEIVIGTLDQVGTPLYAELQALAEADDVEAGLRDLGRQYLASVMQPQVLRMRRLVIAEAARQPDLARTYYERAAERTLAALADCFRRLGARGLLRVDDPERAASHFAFLVLGRPLDRALFYGEEDAYRAAELDAFADAGTDLFLAAYRPG